MQQHECASWRVNYLTNDDNCCVPVCSGSAYPSDWIKRDPLVPVVGFLG